MPPLTPGATPPPPRGILLDLWNTLVFTDRTPHPIAALCAGFGLTGPDGAARLERAIMTHPISGISEALDRLGAITGRPLDAAARRDMVMQWGAACNLNRVYPDVIPALRALATGAGRPRLGLLSNTQSFDLEILRREGIEGFFDAVCLSCRTGLLKPDPAAFLDAAGRLGLPAEAIVMVGDRIEEDVRGAMKAGLQAILIVRGKAPDPPPPVPFIRSLTDLPDRIGVAPPSGASGMG